MLSVKRFRISLHDILIFLLTTAVVCFYDIKPLFLGVQAVAIAHTFYLILRKGTIERESAKYCVWFLMFFLFGILSYAWANPMNTTVASVSISVLQVGLMGLCYIQYANDMAKYNYLIRMLIMAGMMLCLRFMASVPVSSWGRMTRFTKDTIFGSNTPANTLAFTSVITIWYYCYSEKKKPYKGIILSILFMFVSILMGTRKGVIIFGVGIPLLSLLYSKEISTTLWKIILLSGLFFVLYYALLNIPILYQSLGYRLVSMMEGISGDGGDRSFKDRMQFIQDASKVFFEHPILGIGQDGYRYVNSLWKTYSHCNYTEILANLGITGFILYYMYIFKYLKISFKRRKEVPLAFVLLVLMLLIDWFVVAYNIELTYILIPLVITKMRIKEFT